MNDILQIKIIGLDPERYPNVSNNNYIDICYQLSEKAPKEWCNIFNDSFKNDNDVRIDNDSCEFIETWVREMQDIPAKFTIIKENVELANQHYHEKLLDDEKQRQDSYNQEKSSESIELDSILKSLDFG